MPFLSFFAIYFVIWWITLFAVLPIGMRTQEEEGEIVPGTVGSAPARFRGLRVVVLTTIISAAIYAGWYVLTTLTGFSIDDLPRIVPDFGR